MYYPEELIEDIRIHNDILDVVSSYVTLKKKGSSYFGICPFHNEKTPSFSVTPDKQMYYCFGCGAGGNVYTFIMEYENFSFVEAVKHLADRVNIQLPTVEMSAEARKKLDYKQQLLDINKLAARYFYYQIKSDNGKKAKNYILERGIDEEVLKKFGLGYANIYRDDLYNFLKTKKYSEDVLNDSGLVVKDGPEQYHDRFWNRVMFPIFDVHNRVIAFGGRVLGEGMPKYLNSPETKLFDKSKNLYGLNIARVSRKERIIIVEGYMDVIALHQAGYNEAVASLGTALTQDQSRLLKRYTNEVIISYDSDQAGINATLRAIPILKKVGLTVKVLDLTPFKDPDEFIKNKGSELFEERILEAKNSFIFEIEMEEKNFKMDDPEQKTTFLKRISGKILEFESDIEKDNYIEAVSKKYDVNRVHLKNLVDQIGSNVGLIKRNEKEKSVKANKTNKDGVVETQKILLTHMVRRENLFQKVKEYIQPSDFKEPVYNKVASILYEKFEKQEKIQPAQIINSFMSVDEQKQVADLFNSNLRKTDNIELEKLINETVYKLKKSSLDYASRNAKDIEELQKIIVEQSKLQKLHISL